jgi:cellulose synthase/poly-beta-1,6-N-acetylglucosamine synthase-like glycosyltransferase
VIFFLTLLFWLSIFFVFYTYLLFPLLLNFFALSKSQNTLVYKKGDTELPHVSILLAVYNEELVMEEKLTSTFTTDYPLEKISFYIGSDSSTDSTELIIKKFQEKYPQLHLKVFPQRTGKAGIINQLEQQANSEILILTDANVFFDTHTIYNLVKHYKNSEICLVGGNIINNQAHKTGISVQEKTYLTRENKIKYQEGTVWGTMIGAFGGCYSIRKAYFSPVPPKFFMDDFYITLAVLEKEKKAINALDAQCYEDVSNKISEEFRRKVRISIGNFQNLFRYKKLLVSKMPGLAFCFWSHKVIRWFGPFFIGFSFLSNFGLVHLHSFYYSTFVFQLALFTLPLLDEILKRLKVHLSLLRFISHFYLMNLALLIGFFRFISGVESNVWKPTQRFQN